MSIAAAMFAPWGRVYAATDIGKKIVTQLPPKALNDEHALAYALTITGHVVPSLTSVVGYSRILVRRNTSLSTDDKALQTRFTESVKDLAPTMPMSEPVPSAMKVGTAVHRVAELFILGHEWEVAKVKASCEANTMSTLWDWEAFHLYCDALKRVLQDRVLSPGHVIAEHTFFQPQWAGTADVVTHGEVADWKSGSTLSLKSAIIQCVVLADSANRDKAVVIHLGQDATYRTVTVNRGTEVWDLALSLFSAAVRLCHAMIESKRMLLPFRHETGVYDTPESIVAALDRGVITGKKEQGLYDFARALDKPKVTSVAASNDGLLSRPSWM